ncbi:MAG: TetR/AcrR family transcriptional regulator [Bacillota bacterium]
MSVVLIIQSTDVIMALIKRLRGKVVVVGKNAVEQVILDAALEVLVEKSISGTRMHLIAEKAGMAQSNLHYYYKTKHDLLVALYQSIHKRFEEDRKRVRRKNYEDIDSRLQVFFDQKKDIILNQSATDFARIDYWSQGRSDPEFKEMFYEANQVWYQEIQNAIHQFAPNVSQEHCGMISRIMISMMNGASVQYLNHPGLMDLDEYFGLCKAMLLAQIEEFEKMDPKA